MSKTARPSVKLPLLPLAAALVAGATPVAAQATPSTTVVANCREAGQPAALVRVRGFKDRVGNVRVQLYTADPRTFLEKGKKLLRITTPVPHAGAAQVCVPLPQSGRYAIYVLHDRAANGKVDFTQDGVGFSRNPKLRLSKPDVDQVAMAFGPGVTEIDVVMNYRTGLFSVGPARQASR